MNHKYFDNLWFWALSQIDIFVAGLRSSMRHFSVFNHNKNKLSLVQFKKFTCCAVVQTGICQKFQFSFLIYRFLFQNELRGSWRHFWSAKDVSSTTEMILIEVSMFEYFILIWKISTNPKIHYLRIFQELCFFIIK